MSDEKDNSRWESIYREQEVETLPWYFPDLDPDFKRALNEHGITKGRVLDICTGPATQAMALAELGFEVYATDISETAVRQAREIAAKRGLAITFQQADILRDTFDEEFDVLVDRGCFHVFEPQQRQDYIDAISSILKPGGWLLLKCFSHKEKRREGPYRFTPKQLSKYFDPSFEIISIIDAEFTGTLDQYPKTLFSVMRRKSD
jgi:cyclopropane fatty-acyl-phospholipid synthase-like methyltransferase